jgi:hypothetical protein
MMHIRHQLLAYGDDMSLLRDNIDTRNNIDTLTDASKEVGIEVNAEKN